MESVPDNLMLLVHSSGQTKLHTKGRSIYPSEKILTFENGKYSQRSSIGAEYEDKAPVQAMVLKALNYNNNYLINRKDASMLGSRNKYLITSVICTIFPSVAFSTCYHFETAGVQLPEAEICYNEECEIIKMADFCGGMGDGYPYTSSSFNLSNGMSLIKACQANDQGMKCEWNIDGQHISEDPWVMGVCTNKSKEETLSESDPCYQLRLHYN